MPAKIRFEPVVRVTKPPRRITQPRSVWREILINMEPGQWFEVPINHKCAARTAGSKFVRGKYSMYTHPTKQDTYVFTITK
jgi:hypothetical protein